MATLSEYEHNENSTFFIQVLEVLDTDTPKRACEMKVRTPSSETVRFVVWEKSPAASTDWLVDEWYYVRNMIIKQWDTYTELNATSQTTVECVENTILEGVDGVKDREYSKIPSENFSAEQSVEPNTLSEFYEVFRGLSTILDAIIESPSSDVSLNDISHPLVQYYTVIQAILGEDQYLPDDVEGLGEQQLYRVPFEMRELRRQYGNENWLTEYSCIKTAQLSEETQLAIYESPLGESDCQLVRPLTPETGTPLPVLPCNKKELRNALSLLSQFERQPSVPWDNNNSSKFPIEEIYNLFCTNEDITGVQIRRFDDRQDGRELPTGTNKKVSTTAENDSTDRCKFEWSPTEGTSNQYTASCCYRKTWRDYDRCIWHTETDEKKSIKELRQSRETEENRLHNHLPREVLSGAVLRDIQFSDEIFTGVDFSGADLRGCDFSDVYLSYAEFKQATIHDVDFSEATISKTDFRNANLCRANLRDLSLFEVDFTGAKLTNSNFTGSKVEQATFVNVSIEDTEGLKAESTQTDPDFCIHLSADTNITEVDDLLPANLSLESAVIYEIIGEKADNSVRKKEIQNVINRRVKMARGYDKRTRIEKPTNTISDPVPEHEGDQPTPDSEPPVSEPSGPDETGVVLKILEIVRKWFQ